MRLLHTHTLRLESFDDDRQSPEYAILSHTWGEKEITFEDMRAAHLADLPPSPSLQKIEQCCSRARTDGFDYVWIDTCCIDKSSSAELSEAINSMFRWYQHSSVCYAYLQDFELPEMPSSSQVLDEETKPKFRNSRWFHRAWTLQELIAPWSVQFYDANWRWIGSRNEDLLSEICETTSISRDVFLGRLCTCSVVGESCEPEADSGRCRRHFGFDNLSSVLDTFAVSTRLSWAARRESTRVEDQAYSLLGLFNINMPLLYGEGVRAFTRLQRTIVQESRDQSILLWRTNPSGYSGPDFWPRSESGGLAPSLAMFWPPLSIIERNIYWHAPSRTFRGSDIRQIAPLPSSMRLNGTVLQVQAWMVDADFKHTSHLSDNYNAWGGMWLCVLNCTSSQNYLNQYGILLAKASEGYYRRVHTNLVIVCNVLCDRFVDLPSNGLYQDHTLVLRDMDDPQLKTINILTDNGPSSSFQETYYGPSDYYSYEFSDETDTRLCSMTWLAGVPRLQQPPLRQISDMRDVFGFEEGELPMMLYGIHVMKLTAAGLDASIMVVWGVVKDDSSLWTTWCLLFRIGTSSVRHRRYVFEPEKHSLKPREPLETDARVRDFWISLVSSEGDEFYEKDLDALQQLIRSRSILHPWVLLLTPDLELCATVRKTEGLGRVSYCIKFKISSIRTSPDSTTHVNNGSRAEKKRRRRLKQKPF